MEMRRCVSLIVVTALAMSVSGQGQQLIFTPDTIVDGTTSSLTVRCDVSSSDIVYGIKLYKGTTRLARGDSRGATVDPPFQQRATAAGSMDPPNGAYLAVTFNAAVSCSDAGDYRCEYSAGDVAGSPTVNRSLTATSNPGNINMVVTPRLVVTAYNVNASVELECAGEVGFPVVGTWRWETRDVTFASSWTPIRPSIQQTDSPNTGTGCQMRGRSTLRFQVQLEDDNRMYRCSFRSDQYSANFTFQVAAPGNGGSSPSTGNSGAPGTANVGMIVGIVLGVLAAIAVVVVLVFFFVFKKKRNRANDYDTGEGGKDGRTYPDEDLHGNPVYTLPNKDKYGGGVDNEAMDGQLEAKDQDPGDRHRSKPRRGHQDDHPNGGEGRRHHRDRHARDRDDGRYPNDHRHPSDPNEEPYPESRHYSSYEEDDGTDNRGYVPQEAIGSAV